MGQGVSGGVRSDQSRGQVQTLGGNGHLVVTQIELIKERVVVKVPEMIVEEVRTTKYIPVAEPTVKYNVTEKETVVYNTQERDTIRYNVCAEETIKYIPVEVKCEKPILIDKPYERPVIINKEYTLVTFKDMEAIRELMELAPALLAELKELRKYKLVEEVIKVPRIEYVPTTIKRVTKTGELIQDAE